VYGWVDGIHVNVRLDEDKLCLLVIVGVGADGTKELVALADGYRESTGSWAGPAARLRPARYARPGPGLR
jgi:transposase-like protein